MSDKYSKSSRREFLKKLGLAGLSIPGLGMIGNSLRIGSTAAT